VVLPILWHLHMLRPPPRPGAFLRSLSILMLKVIASTFLFTLALIAVLLSLNVLYFAEFRKSLGVYRMEYLGCITASLCLKVKHFLFCGLHRSFVGNLMLGCVLAQTLLASRAVAHSAKSDGEARL
jgi:hypothetical protein